MVDEATHLRSVAKFVPTIAGSSHHAHVLAAVCLAIFSIRRSYSWMRSLSHSTSRNSGSNASRNSVLNPLVVLPTEPDDPVSRAPSRPSYRISLSCRTEGSPTR